MSTTPVDRQFSRLTKSLQTKPPSMIFWEHFFENSNLEVPWEFLESVLNNTGSSRRAGWIVEDVLFLYSTEGSLCIDLKGKDCVLHLYWTNSNSTPSGSLFSKFIQMQRVKIAVMGAGVIKAHTSALHNMQFIVSFHSPPLWTLFWEMGGLPMAQYVLLSRVELVCWWSLTL